MLNHLVICIAPNQPRFGSKDRERNIRFNIDLMPVYKNVRIASDFTFWCRKLTENKVEFEVFIEFYSTKDGSLEEVIRKRQ